MLSSLSICAGRSGREHEKQGNESGREWMVNRLEGTSGERLEMHKGPSVTSPE